MQNVLISSRRVANELSAAQRTVLVAIRDHFSEFQISPTYVEVAERLSTSKSNARRAIDRLVLKGFICKVPGGRRNIVITPRGYQAAGSTRNRRLKP